MTLSRLRAALAAPLLLAAGCVTVPPTGAPTAQSGTLLLSLGSAGKMTASSHTLYIENVQTHQRFSLTYKQKAPIAESERDFDDARGNGVVIAASLPPGNYELQNFTSFQSGYPDMFTFESALDGHVPFTIRAREASYIGEYLAHQSRGIMYFIVSDQSERDLAIARRKHVAIDPRELDYQILVSQSHTPLFRTDPLPPNYKQRIERAD